MKKLCAGLLLAALGSNANAGPVIAADIFMEHSTNYSEETETWHSTLFYEQGTKNILGFKAENMDTGYGFSMTDPGLYYIELQPAVNISDEGSLGLMHFSMHVTDTIGNGFYFYVAEIQLPGFGLEDPATLDYDFVGLYALRGDAPGSSYLKDQGIFHDAFYGGGFEKRNITVPEPASLGLVTFGVAAIGFARRRKQVTTNA